jgi:CheY-like chemotaxis protein
MNISLPLALVLDDDPMQRRLIKRMLHDRFKVIEASDVRQALELFRSHKDELKFILTDVQLTRGNSIPFHMAVQAEAESLGIGRLVMTGHCSDDERRYFDEHGLTVVSKPLSKEALITAIENLCTPSRS